MHFKAALLATLAAGSLFLTACGGGGGDGGGGGSSPASEPQPSPPASEPQQLPPAACQPQTIVGGALFVAEQAPVGVTLLSNGGLAQYEFIFLYDNVFGIPTNNRQDKWGALFLFPPGTPVGTSTQVQLEPFPFIHGEQTPSTFPKGFPVELYLIGSDDGNPVGPTNHSSTGGLNKDIGHDFWHTASVTYGANNTATVTFFPSSSGAHFSVGLTNVLGPTGSGSGC